MPTASPPDEARADVHPVNAVVQSSEPVRAKPAQLHGYTLIEVGVALLLIGILVAIAVPTVNALVGAELKRSTGMMQGLMRDTYARAALSGNAHRVVFDLDNNSYWVEMAEGGVVMPRDPLELTNEGGANINAITDKRLEDLDEDDKDEEDMAKKRLLGPPKWTPVPAPGADDLENPKPQFLPSRCIGDEVDGCVRFKKIWADHLADPAYSGVVGITFFPGGYTQEAHVTLTDEENGDRVFTLELQPLTAEVYVHDDEPAIPEVDR